MIKDEKRLEENSSYPGFLPTWLSTIVAKITWEGYSLGAPFMAEVGHPRTNPRDLHKGVIPGRISDYFFFAFFF